MRVAVTGPSDLRVRASERLLAAGGQLVEACSADVLLALGPCAGVPSEGAITVQSAAWENSCASRAVLALDAPTEVLRRQLAGWAGLAAAERELKIRHETLRCLDFDAPRTPAPPSIQMLYVGAPDSSFIAIADTLRRQSITLHAALSASTGLDHLQDQNIDALILHVGNDPRSALSMCAALRCNATLTHLPKMVIAEDLSLTDQALDRGAEIICTKSAACGPALSWLITAAVREQRVRCAHKLLQSIQDCLGEVRTGLWSVAAFKMHLGRLALHHQERPLALVVFSVLPAHGARQPTGGNWSRTLAETANLTAQLIRADDCGALLAGDALALAMPGLSLDAAKKTSARIASVVECSAFVGAGPLVLEQTVVGLRRGEGAEALLARAMLALNLADSA